MQKQLEHHLAIAANIRTANRFDHADVDTPENVKNFEQLKIIVTFLRLNHTK
jgi:hypothetical protein